MILGDFQLTTISGGVFRIDAGTMFGVVPKVLWQRVVDVDANNLMTSATNCVLIETGEKTILIETGYGSKFSEKKRRIHGAEPGDPLVENLAAQGIGVEQVDMVILSHLHFDHAGGATQLDDQGNPRPTFPNATYVAQRLEWVNATANFPELQGAYPQDNLLPLAAAGQLQLIDGDVEIVPGIRAEVNGGHTAGHQSLFIESGGETAVFIGDICPMAAHLPPLWCMAYDVDLLQTRRAKPELLGRIAEHGWWALFDHDPEIAAARLQRDAKRGFVVAEALPQL